MPEAQILLSKLGNEGKSFVRVMDKDVAFKRSKVTATSKGDSIVIKIVADDTTALVASMSSMLKQIRVIHGAKDVVKRLGKGQR